ncbi:hypothetical protein ONE63_002290 [Megalurothrips usitatus]|uniref:Centrosomal protein of 162 kDa n=1 Tax=Megalurothrips usitatus TaxID=439358 RepID=A0AAV7XBH3_9NEOP|nr:hypothetical protein ONE63_002290 [Megalurothrips usitatus]
MFEKSKMKGKDDVQPEAAGEASFSPGLSAGKTGNAPDASSLSSFIHQEKLCKELYLSMGVHPNDIADTSDDDVASILEQISRLHPSGRETGAGGDRNIEDILREAESLLDGPSQSKPRSISSRSGSVVSATVLNVRSDRKQRLLNVTQTINQLDSSSGSKLADDSSFDEVHDYHASKTPRLHGSFVPSHIVGTPLEVTYKRIYEQMRKEVDGTLKSHLTGDFPDLKLSLPIPGLDTPSFDVPGCFNLEQEFLVERKRCLKLKADLDWLKRQHEHEVAELRKRHEGQLNQVREELRPQINQDPSVLALQNEVKAKEQIIKTFKEENKNLEMELKDIKGTLQQIGDQTTARKLAETKVLRSELEKELSASLRPQLEKEVRPQLEKELRSRLEKEAAAERERAQARTLDLERQVRELEGIVRKRQPQLQHQSSSDLPCSSPARERQLQLQAAEQEWEQRVRQLQEQAAERRASERLLQEHLQAAEEQLQERHSGAAKVQVHLHAVKAKYEDLVSSLEEQLAAARQEVSDLKERAVHNVPSSASSEAGESLTGEQHAEEPQRDDPRRPPLPPPPAGGVARARRPRRSQSAGESSPLTAVTPSAEIQVMPHQQNRPVQPAKPDAHLLATIRGLQHEMQAKDKELAKLNRELSDARATNRRLQQERQRLLNEAGPPRPKPAAAPAAPVVVADPDLEAENRGLRRDVQRLQEDLLSLHAKRVGDLTRLQAKHEEELESVVCERVSERLSDRSCEGRVAELQGQLYTQQLVIAHLKEQLKHSEHNGEEVAMLKRERDQLEKSVVCLTKQVSRLKEAASDASAGGAPPDARRAARLQEQLDDLEARHEVRERKLQAIVKDLLQQRQQQDRGPAGPGAAQDACCSASVRLLHKNRDLCFYRAEMDRLLEALRDLERTRHSPD